MLKFFRKYNKYILAVGGSLLMIGFLIQPVMSMFQADPMAVALGTVGDDEITRRDLASAEAQMAVLARYGLRLDRDPDATNDNNNNLRWALILYDAQQLGLSASQAEVNQLRLEAGQSDADIEMMATRFNATPQFVLSAMRNWLVVQQYKEVVAGQRHLAGTQRAAFMRSMYQSPQTYELYEALSYGSSRLSKPLVEHFLQDQGARVAGQVVLIRADQLLDQAPKPSEEEIQALFDLYKDALPGEGADYGFGYRVPDRVKLEYLSISMDDARRVVKATEAQALAYYRKNTDRYTDTPATADAPEAQAATVKPYEQVRGQVFEDLTEENAFLLVEKMTKAAYGMLYEDTRGMAKQAGYRVVADPLAVTTLRQIAERLEADFGLLPQVRRMTDEWINADDLRGLPGLGLSALASDPRVDFTSFVLSARELKPESDNPLTPLRLQAHLAGSPMRVFDGSRYIFRLTDAQPTRVPDSLDQVRDRVQRDARLLSAYRELMSQAQTRRAQAVKDGLEAVASQANTSVVPVPATSRRIPDRNGLLVPPPLAVVGQSEAFVQAFFATADRARAAGPIDQADAEALIGAVGLDHKLGLALYRIEDYEPLTEAQFQAVAASPIVTIQIERSLFTPIRLGSPLSLKSLTHRLNYISAQGGSRDDEKAEEADGADPGEGV